MTETFTPVIAPYVPTYAARQSYITPDEFAGLKEDALRFGFRHVESGPLIRSSYRAWEHVK